MLKDAIIDKSKKYRYLLTRQWGSDKNNFVNFVMLNPSTADDKIDDPTIRSCIRLAKEWGFDGLYATNLFALRATDPKELKCNDEPIGVENDIFIEKIALLSKLVVIAWGNHGVFHNRDEEIIKKLKKIITPFCLKRTKIGQPIHPLFISKNTKPIQF